jgi:hypothetical protein
VVRTTGPNDSWDGLGATINWDVPRYNINVCVYMQCWKYAKNKMAKFSLQYIYIYICVYMVLVHAVLDYSIRGLLIPSISHRFYDWIDQMGSSSMVLEPRS